MIIIPEAIKTLVNVFMAIFAKKEDLKQSDWNQSDITRLDYIKNKPQELPEKEFLVWLNEAKVVEPVASASGEIYTTNNNEIYVL
jgi:hypothetical protein